MKKTKILVTAGNTRIPIDKVRGIDNIFKGRTGVAIAEYLAGRCECDVTLLTSHPELVRSNELTVLPFNTYDHLLEDMEKLVRGGSFDVIIHSAAVSDYKVGGIYAQTGHTQEHEGRQKLELIEQGRSGKVGSNHPELWLKLTPTIKIVDQIREPWGFRGTLVKFKLQVGMSDSELVEIATKSMHHSKADFIVANTLEGLTRKAFIISAKGNSVVEVVRGDLPIALYRELGI